MCNVKIVFIAFSQNVVTLKTNKCKKVTDLKKQKASTMFTFISKRVWDICLLISSENNTDLHCFQKVISSNTAAMEYVLQVTWLYLGECFFCPYCVPWGPGNHNHLSYYLIWADLKKKFYQLNEDNCVLFLFSFLLLTFCQSRLCISMYKNVLNSW